MADKKEEDNVRGKRKERDPLIETDKKQHKMVGTSKAGNNAKFPRNMVKNCVKNVNYFRNFRIFCKKKTEIYI